MGRKHAKTVAAAAGAAATKIAPVPVQLATASGNADSATLAPFCSAGLAERATAGLSRHVSQFVDVLRLGAFVALGSTASAQLGRTTRVLHGFVDVMAAERVVATLQDTSLLNDAVHPRNRPLLALSHLESLAHSSLVFGAARDLLNSFGGGSSAAKTVDSHHGAVLLQVSGDEDELSEAIMSLVFSDAVRDESTRASALARLSSLLFHFKPHQKSLSVDILDAMHRLHCVDAGGNSLEMFLHGLGELLPTTRTGLRPDACSSGQVPMLLCQVLERLFYPMSEAVLLLQLCCPAVAAHGSSITTHTALCTSDVCTAKNEQRPTEVEPSITLADRAGVPEVVTPAQSEEFLETLSGLETEALPSGFQPFNLWALEAGGRHYVLLLE